jgi:hypothetical protein
MHISASREEDPPQESNLPPLRAQDYSEVRNPKHWQLFHVVAKKS